MFAKIDIARDHSTSIEILEVIKSASPNRVKGMKSILAHLWIDQYHFFVCPVAIGKGLTIFSEVGRYFKLKQIDATPCECGITIHNYLPEMATKPQSSKAGSAA